MKRIHVCICISIIFFTACKKDDAKLASPVSQKSAQLAFKGADQIPSEIIPLLYNDLIKDKLFEQAENLRVSYYNTLSIRKDNKTDVLKATHADVLSAAKQAGIMAANLPFHSVPGVGVVLDGTWYTTSGVTSSNEQAIGWVDINFSAMNTSATDAFNSTAPTSTSQYMGTVNQQRRLEAFKLPLVQFGAADNLGTTYFTPSFGFTFTAHVQAIGWQNYVSSSPNTYAGTVGESRRMEAVKIFGPRYSNNSYTLTFNDPAPSTQARPYIYYRVHQEAYGWEDWKGENDVAGITGQSKRIEAMQVRAYLVKVQ
jgi:hypothetical protein